MQVSILAEGWLAYRVVNAAGNILILFVLQANSCLYFCITFAEIIYNASGPLFAFLRKLMTLDCKYLSFKLLQ